MGRLTILGRQAEVNREDILTQRTPEPAPTRVPGHRSHAHLEFLDGDQSGIANAPNGYPINPNPATGPTRAAKRNQVVAAVEGDTHSTVTTVDQVHRAQRIARLRLSHSHECQEREQDGEAHKLSVYQVLLLIRAFTDRLHRHTLSIVSKSEKK